MRQINQAEKVWEMRFPSIWQDNTLGDLVIEEFEL